MKKAAITLFIGIIFNLNSFSQSPVYFPDGLVVGPTTLTIPTTSAAYKMAVAGGIITEKVRVATNGSMFWADFVFDKNYRMRSLAELEQYIKVNKHLPDMPTTAEVGKNGIDLAETQALLLQKIEELTLYQIEQNKKIERLERQVKVLSKRKK